MTFWIALLSTNFSGHFMKIVSSSKCIQKYQQNTSSFGQASKYERSLEAIRLTHRDRRTVQYKFTVLPVYKLHLLFSKRFGSTMGFLIVADIFVAHQAPASYFALIPITWSMSNRLILKYLHWPFWFGVLNYFTIRDEIRLWKGAMFISPIGPRWQGSWGQQGAHLGPGGPRWAPC